MFLTLDIIIFIIANLIKVIIIIIIITIMIVLTAIIAIIIKIILLSSSSLYERHRQPEREFYICHNKKGNITYCQGYVTSKWTFPEVM